MIGHHVTWDVYHCNAETLKYTDSIQRILNELVDALSLSKIDEAYNQFKPFGATGFILLEESHISIHTWPEFNYAAIDVFSCKAFDVQKINLLIEQLFESDHVMTQSFIRGTEIPTLKNTTV
jgi:S-adenosylmethionine decarboxylase